MSIYIQPIFSENLSDLQSKIASLQLAIKNKTGMSGPDTLTGDHEDKVQELMTIISDLETQHRKELQELEDSLQTSRNTIEIYKQTTKNQEDVISILQANGMLGMKSFGSSSIFRTSLVSSQHSHDLFSSRFSFKQKKDNNKYPYRD